MVTFLCMALASIPLAAEPIRGRAGVGTWETQAEFTDIRVTRDGKTLYASDFAAGMKDVEIAGGQWQAIDGALRQSSDQRNARALFGDPAWSDYTLSLRARKLGGKEGFLILFGIPQQPTTSWWNLGGWNNTRHGLQVPGVVADSRPGKIETGRWYDIRIELTENRVQAYLDNELIHDAKQTPASRDFGRPLIPDLLADPSIVEIDGTFYCYGTTDGAGAGLATAGLPVVWKSTDFVNWSFTGSIFANSFDAKYWAPSGAIRRNNRYYLFPTLDNKITAVVSDSPEGPFRTPDGREVNRQAGWEPFPLIVGNPIDAEVFRDDDGSYYMVWSMHGIGKLNDDFSGFEGEQRVIPVKRGGYSEGPYLFKRKGIYYYLYTLDGHENYKYAYMMSRTSPLGPWEAPEQDIIAVTDHEKGIYGPGHGCFFNPQGTDRWIFVYLEYGRSGTNRQVWANEMHFNADGTIRPIEVTLEGVGALRVKPEGKLPDLALGKTATASSTRADERIPPIADHRLNRIEGFAPANAVDGSNGSRWMASKDDSEPAYLLDLGEAREIRRTELYFVTPTGGHSYRLEHSLDGKRWDPYAAHSEAAVQSPHTDTRTVRTRYLKLKILRGTPGLWEFRVF